MFSPSRMAFRLAAAVVSASAPLQLPATTAAAASNTANFAANFFAVGRTGVIRSSWGAGHKFRGGRTDLWPLYRLGVWRHKVNPATAPIIMRARPKKLQHGQRLEASRGGFAIRGRRAAGDSARL